MTLQCHIYCSSLHPSARSPFTIVQQQTFADDTCYDFLLQLVPLCSDVDCQILIFNVCGLFRRLTNYKKKELEKLKHKSRAMQFSNKYHFHERKRLTEQTEALRIKQKVHRVFNRSPNNKYIDTPKYHRVDTLSHNCNE